MIAKKAPDFCLLDQNSQKTCLRDFKGKWVVLYSYPKDDTPGCTIEAIDFTGLLKEFEDLDAMVLGISPDTTESHKKFEEKHKLKVTLLSDPEHKAIERFGAWKKKNMHGKEYMGVQRSTIIISPKGKIAFHWPKVQAQGHAMEVKQKLAELQKEQEN